MEFAQTSCLVVRSNSRSQLQVQKKWPECVYTHRISQVVQWRKKDRTSQDFSYQESKRSKRSEEIMQQEMRVILIYTYCQNSSRRRDDEGGGERWRFMSHTEDEEQKSVTCSLWPWGAGCKGRASPSGSWGRGAHLCDCGGRCGGQGHIPPGQLVGDTLRSLLWE